MTDNIKDLLYASIVKKRLGDFDKVLLQKRKNYHFSRFRQNQIEGGSSSGVKEKK